MLGFETLTLVPINHYLIETTLMSKDELNWLNQYHERVCQTLMPLIDAQTRSWLLRATAPL